MELDGEACRAYLVLLDGRIRTVGELYERQI